MKTFKIGLTLFLTFTFFCCTSQKTEWQGTIEEVDGIRVIKNPNEPLYGEITFDLEEDLVIGNEIDENYSFYKGISVAVDKDRNIYVSDSGNQRIQKFNKSGKFLQSIGKKGQGPGEFEHPSGIAFDKENNIYVKDNRAVEIFDESGSFIRSISLGASIISWGVTSGGDIIGVDFSYDSKGLLWKLVHFASKSGKSRILKEFEPHKFGAFMFNGVAVGGYNPYSPRLMYCTLDDKKAVYAYSSIYRLHVINGKGDSVLVIEKEGSPENISEKEKDSVLRTEISVAERSGKKLSKNELKKKYPFPKYKPYFTNLRTDDLGNIYVLKLTRDMLKTKMLECDLFNNNGYYIFKIKFPSIVPMVIRNGFIYEVRADRETGYLRIKRYKVTNWNKISSRF